MTEPEPAPTSSQIECAIGLRDMHTKAQHTETCAWCFRPWPCPDRCWSGRILRLAREARHGQ